jgi:hypothetical protein
MEERRTSLGWLAGGLAGWLACFDFLVRSLATTSSSSSSIIHHPSSIHRKPIKAAPTIALQASPHHHHRSQKARKSNQIPGQWRHFGLKGFYFQSTASIKETCQSARQLPLTVTRTFTCFPVDQYLGVAT